MKATVRNHSTCSQPRQRFCVFFCAVSLLLGAGNAGLAQQTLTVSPSTTSNTYTGVITLNITGLMNGEKVSIEKWLDLNANGTIDPGEPLVDVFKITDNDLTNNLIGGVMDINALGHQLDERCDHYVAEFRGKPCH